MSKFIILILSISLFNWSSAQLTVKKVCDLPKKMNETSGILSYNNNLITHNDGGNKSEIYILTKKGKHIRTINILDTKNNDWEDLAQDDNGNIYIGDFGNNLNKRKHLSILLLKKGFIDKDKVIPEKISFYYENQKQFPPKKKNLNYDCEAFFYKDGYLYLLTKCRTKPFTGISYIYRIPAKKGHHKAELINQLQFCKSSWYTCSVTSADYHSASNTLTILTYKHLFVITNFEGDQFKKGDTHVYKIPSIKQREAITYVGQNKWYMTDEFRKGFGGGNLYKLTIDK